MTLRAALGLMVGVLLICGYLAEQINNERYRGEVRQATHQQLADVSEDLNARLQADLHQVHGLVSVINLVPDLTQRQLEIAARPLFTGHSHLRNIAVAPDLVVSLMYPMAGNERALGLDYRKTPAQSAAALKARDTREVVLAGPLTLVQGGTGLIARLPVFIPDPPHGDRFWGLVSAVINADALFRNSGLMDTQGPLEFALRGTDGSGPTGPVITGRAALFDEHPETVEIQLPHGSWLLAAAPRQGWPQQADNAWGLRALMAGLALALLASVGAINRVLRSADQARALAEAANQNLASLIEGSPDAMVTVDQDGRITLVNQQTEQLFGWTRAELMGQPFKLLLRSSARVFPSWANLRDGAAQTPPQRHAFELLGRHKDGSAIDLDISLSPVDTPQGPAVTGILRDIRARKQAEARALASEHRVSVIADHLPVLISHFDTQVRYQFANAYFGRLFNIDHRTVLGQTLKDFRGEAVYAQLEVHVAAALAGHSSSFDSSAVIGGQLRHFHQNYVPDLDAEGKVQGFFSVSVDMTELKRSEIELARTEARLRTITDNMPALIAHVDDKRVFTFANATWREIYQVEPQDLTGRHVSEVLGQEFYDKRRAYIDTVLLAGERVEYEVEVKVGPQPRMLKVILIPDFNEQQRVVGMYSLGLDVTAQKTLEHQLTTLARVDHLTGLANRRSFEDKLDEASKRSRRQRDLLAVMFIDVDHFKQINDTQGHAVGDSVLIEVAQRLQAAVRSTDAVSRLGGDEFVVLLEALSDPAEAALVADKILLTLRAPMRVADRSLAITTSIGIGFLDGRNPAHSPSQTLAQADGALYQSKRQGRDRRSLGSLSDPV